MGLNVKLALLISLSFIGAMSWLVHEVAWPLTQTTSGNMAARTTHPPAAAAHVAPVNAGPNTDRVQGRFARTGPAEVPASPKRTAADSMVIKVPPINRTTEPETVMLPPLIRTSPEPSPASEAPTRLAAGSGEADTAALIALNSKPVPIGELPQPTHPAPPQVYKVQRGDTLAKIAQRTWKSDDPKLVALLIEANRKSLKNPDRLLAGQELTIPERPDPSAKTVAEKNAKNQSAPKAAKEESGGKPVEAVPGKPALADSNKKKGVVEPATARKPVEAGQERWYIIQDRDSLTAIAKRELKDERRWREIAKLNGLADGSKIVPGMRIKLPANEKLAHAR